MKYSRKATLELAKDLNSDGCLEPISNLIVKEGYKGSVACFSGDELVLDMDCVERVLSKNKLQNPASSMDSAFVAEDGVKSEIVMVEYRFNYLNMSNLNRKKLLDKVAGTTAALHNPVNIHHTNYFVFEDTLKQQAINRFGRMNPRVPQTYEAVTMEDIKDLFFK